MLTIVANLQIKGETFKISKKNTSEWKGITKPMTRTLEACWNQVKRK